MNRISLIILIFISLNSFANTCEVTQFIVPPAKALDWSSNNRLAKSFIKSQLKAIKISRTDVQRKAVGHVVSLIKSENYERWTSISVNPIKALPKLLKRGIKGIFNPVKGAIVQNKNKILRFLYRNRKNLIFIKSKTYYNICDQLLNFDNNLRRKAKRGNLFFGPTLEDIEVGGTGASYAVYMLKLLRLDLPYTELKEQIDLQGNDPYSFYDSYKMWSYVTKHSNEKNTTYQKLTYRKYNFTLRGILVE